MASNAVKRGLMLSPASWNTIWMRARSGSSAKRLAGVCESSRGPSLMLPSVGSSSRVSDAHQGGLAAAGFADEPDGLALADGEAHVVDRMDLRQLFRPAGEALAQPRDRARRPPTGKRLESSATSSSAGRHSGFQQATMMRISATGARQRPFAGDELARAAFGIAARRQIGAAQIRAASPESRRVRRGSAAVSGVAAISSAV